MFSEMMILFDNTYLSKLIKSIPPILRYKYNTYDIFFEGDSKNTSTISGLYSYELPYYTYCIPTLSGITTNETLYENTDYIIKDNKYLQFLTTPQYNPYDLENENSTSLYAEETYQHNPVLWDVHASGIGMSIDSMLNEEYLPYTALPSAGLERTQIVAEHYKFLIWGLETIRRANPTISNLQKGNALSLGYPFAYRPGIVTSLINDNINITVSGLDEIDTYTVNSDLTRIVASGQAVDRFDILTEHPILEDSISDMDLIMSLEGVNEFNYMSTVCFVNPSEVLNRSDQYHQKYLKSLMPAGLTYKTITE